MLAPKGAGHHPPQVPPMPAFNDKVPQPQQGVHFHLHGGGEETISGLRGDVFLTLTDAETGEVLQQVEKHNIITRDAGILAAIMFSAPLSRNSLNMLAVGTGATGNILSPDAPDNRQRKLNTPLFRKAFATTTFRTTTGVAVAYPTNIVDFTTTFATNEANGALNEMGLVSAVNLAGPALPNPNAYPTYDPTVDVSGLDILVNYLTFPVISKTVGTVLTVTWRLTF